jgi:streptogramin lyase
MSTLKILALSLLIAATSAVGADGWQLTTIAGGGFRNDGPATSVRMKAPHGVTVDASGNLFIGEMNGRRVCRLDVKTGLVTTVAGNGINGYSGDGGPATAAQLSGVSDVAVDGAGNLFIVDWYNSCIRRIDGASGVITTVTASLGLAPSGIALDGSGNVLFSSLTTNCVHRVDKATGALATVAGNGRRGGGGDHGPAVAAQLDTPEGIAVDELGNLFIADGRNYRIRRVDAQSQIITTVAGKDGPSAVSRLLGSILDGEAGGFSGDGGPAIAAQLFHPTSVAVDRSGNLFISDSKNQRIRRVDAKTGTITTVAGNGQAGFAGDNGPASAAQLNFPGKIAIDLSGGVLIADTDNNRVRHLAPAP